MQESLVQFLGWGVPLEEHMVTHCRILAWRISMDRGAWQSTVHGGHKELDTTEWLSIAQTVDSFKQLFAECLQCGIP